MKVGALLSIAGRLARHPGLWVTACRQAKALAATGWWRRRPFLPLPPAEYLRFRMVTQYGDAEHVPQPDDVVSYLAWSKRQPR